MAVTGLRAALIAALGMSAIAYHYTHRPVDISHIKLLDEHLPAPIIEADQFLVKLDSRQFNCMRTNLYYEGRNQKSDDAMIAVGYTVLNRIHSNNYPNTICGVVTQAKIGPNGKPLKNKCQFSWYCDGKGKTITSEPPSDNILEKRAWDRAGTIAAAVMRNEVDNPIGDAIMYHATYVRPRWRRAYQQVAQIESHIFYETKSKS